MSKPEQQLKELRGRPDIEVTRDGLRLGWNTFAILASLSLGLYVSSVIAPLATGVEDNKARLDAIQIKQQEIADAIAERKLANTTALGALDSRIQVLQVSLTKMEQRLDKVDYWAGRNDNKGANQ